MSNIVYIATSIDGYIADRSGSLSWLETVPNPNQVDFGWDDFIHRIDAIVMGRKTFETVLNFESPWPYSKKVFVITHNQNLIPQHLEKNATTISGTPSEIVSKLHDQGFSNLYIDGGSIIQQFLKEDVIDEMIITRIPILLGGGTLLFGELPQHIIFEHKHTKVLLDEIVMSHYVRKKMPELKM